MQPAVGVDNGFCPIVTAPLAGEAPVSGPTPASANTAVIEAILRLFLDPITCSNTPARPETRLCKTSPETLKSRLRLPPRTYNRLPY
jgi:hypothetical protein